MTRYQPQHRRTPSHGVGRTLALVLPVVLVLSGTLAVAGVNWSGNPAGSDSVLTASAAELPSRTAERAPEDVLRDRLLTELQGTDPGKALTGLQRAVDRDPSLAHHCTEIARELGRAAVQRYGAVKAQSFARPVCDTAFAAGVVDAGS